MKLVGIMACVAVTSAVIILILSFGNGGGRP